MSTLDIAMVMFLGIVLVVGVLGFLIYNFKKED